MADKRETFSTRLGFILLSAGCAIGLGNVWRFPTIVGKNGGAIFVLFYLFFLFIFGLPILIAEFSIGRKSRKSIVRAFHEIEPAGSKWHWQSFFAVSGNYLLMMFYTTVAGWMIYYFFTTAKGSLSGLSPSQVSNYFNFFVSCPEKVILCMAIVVFGAFGVCALGLQKGVERFVKILMAALLFILITLAIYVAFIPGASAGYSFYLKPDVNEFLQNGVVKTITEALGQSFFTLSLGIGSMTIFGSYIGKEYTLTSESIKIVTLDTFVALGAGMIIFPSCFAFGIEPNAGPGLVFVTLPNVFNSMNPLAGRIVGALFFLFLCFAAFTTVIAVFENIIAFSMDEKSWSRKKSVAVNMILIFLLSLPCAFGMNLLSDVKILGFSIDGFEDFIVSNNLLPLGSIVILCFCTWKNGWGWDNFVEEVDTGKGLKFPKHKFIKFYLKYIVPVIVVFLFVVGYIDLFKK